MTHEQRTERIKTLTRELSTLLAQETPRPAVKFLSAQDVPAWVAEGLCDAIHHKRAEERRSVALGAGRLNFRSAIASMPAAPLAPDRERHSRMSDWISEPSRGMAQASTFEFPPILISTNGHVRAVDSIRRSGTNQISATAI
jgi:hypothetical protein